MSQNVKNYDSWYPSCKEKDLKNRIDYLDVARGIAIILMIIGHVVTPGWKRTIIFSFHMPLFIIISGMFFKTGNSLKYELLNLFKKLIMPYILTIIITYILKYFIYNQTTDFLNIFKQIIFAYSNRKTFFTDINGVGVLWFIPFLVICKIMYYWIEKFSRKNEVLTGFICTTFTVIGIYLSKIEIFLPWSFDVALASMLFFYIGYLLKEYNLLEKILSDYKVFICIIILYIVGIKFGYIELAIRSYPYGLICYITAVCGTIIVFQISKIIEKFSKYIKRVLCWYGKNSMYILCVHCLEWNIIQYTYFGINTKPQLIIAKLLIVTLITSIYLFIINKLKVKVNKTYKV